MPWQASLDFDETYAWVNFIKQVEQAKQGQKFIWYGFKNKKTIIVKISPHRVLIINQSMLSSKGEVKYENNVRFFEVEVMSKALIEKHLCTYERSATKADVKPNQIYRCVDPDCNSYKPVKFLVGKRARCYKCKEPYITYKEQFEKLNKHLVCEFCSKSKKAVKLNKAAQATQDMLNDLGIGVEIKND